MTDVQELTDEISRIVASTYPPSLKRLFDLTRRADACTIRLWMEANSCKIDPLLHAVLEGLNVFPHALEILEKLYTFLRKALRKEDEVDEYSAICVTILSSPLPEDVLLPAATYHFLSRKLEGLERSPSVSNIRPIYLMLAGACTGGLEDMPPELLARFQKQLLRLLKSLEDHHVCLFCLAILATVVIGHTAKLPSVPRSPCSDRRSPKSSETEISVPHYDSLRQFFVSEKASKTLEFVALQLAYACSGSSSMGVDQAREILELAQVIGNAIDPQIRKLWVDKNSRGFRKMIEKITRSGLSAELQFPAFDFLASLSMDGSLPIGEISLLKDAIHPGGKLSHVYGLSGGLSPFTIERLAPHFDEDYARQILHTLLTLANSKEPGTIDTFRMTRSALILVQNLTEALSGSRTLIRGTLIALTSNELKPFLQEFISLSGCETLAEQRCSSQEACSLSCRQNQNELRQLLCSFFLKAALCAGTEEIGIEASLAVSLVDMQRYFAKPQPSCCVSQFLRDTDPLGAIASKLAQTRPQSSSSGVLDWKKSLANDLLQGARVQYKEVLDKVALVCRDLEERCEDIESPLRLARSELREARSCFEDAQSRIAQLESEAVERNLFLDGMEVEKTQLQDRLGAAESEANDFKQRVQELEGLLENAKLESERAMASAKALSDKNELEYLAILSTKEEAIEYQHMECRRANEEAQALTENLHGLRHEKSEAVEHVVQLEHILDKTKQELNTNAIVNVEKDTRIKNLVESERILTSKVEALNNDLVQLTAKHQNSTSEAAGAQKDLETKIDELVLLHASEKELFRADAERLEQARNDETSRAETQLRNVEWKAGLERDKSCQKISELNTKIGVLLQGAEDQDRELLQLREWRTRLMSVMGHSSHNHDPTSIDQHGKSNSYSQFPPQAPNFGTLDDQNTQSTPNLETEKIVQLENSFDSGASSISGPTPKRTRRRKYSRTTKVTFDKTAPRNAHETNHGKQASLEAVLPSTHRLPFGEKQNAQSIGGDQTTAKRLERGDAEGTRQELILADSSFDDRDLIISTWTPSSHIDRGKENIPSCLYDETTQDF
ncbi:MAG: hypothetical protein M1819_006362 [Sarea resinae]|nr:MAG: hypothetical protein M1819_006362 [Sarea resinae]